MSLLPNPHNGKLEWRLNGHNYLYLPGRAGGQTAYGGTASRDDLTLGSTAHATKGNINFGTYSTYDEVNLRLGLKKMSPTQRLELYDGNLSFDSVDAPVACTATLASGAGNVDNGNHIYRVTFRSIAGETNLGAASNTVTVIDKTINGQISLSGIPTAATTDAITSRRIYRTKAGGSNYFLLTTINDNTTTTFTDNVADADLTAVNVGNAYNRDNTIRGAIYKDGYKYIHLGGNMSFGKQALQNLDAGYSNLAIGSGSLYTLTSGAYNCCLGNNSGYKLTSGQQNMFIGTYAGYNATTTAYTVAIGNWALGGAILTSYGQVGIGSQALRNNNGNYTVAIGYGAGYMPNNNVANASTADAACTYLGYFTGNAGTTALTGSVALGYRAVVGSSYSIVLGGTGSYKAKVGIGMTSPGTVLDVYGTHVSDVGIMRYKGDGQWGYVTADQSNASGASGFLLNINGTKKGQIEYYAGTGLKLQNVAADASNPQMVINDSGYTRFYNRVGVNTAPSYHLDVAGDAFPVMRVTRNYDTSDIVASGFLLRTKKATDMGSGYGGGFVMGIEDDTSGLKYAGRLACARLSTDDTSRIMFDVDSDLKTVMQLESGKATFGNNVADQDWQMLFKCETNDGRFYWMEDEDYFKFDDSILFPDNEPLYFGTGADMSAYYDGTSSYVKTDLVAPSDLYIDCGTDKTIVLEETVWNDIQFVIESGRVSAANFPDWDSTFTANTGCYKFDIDDYIDLGGQELSHDWKEGSTLKPHLHIALDGANASGSSQYIKFIAYISYADANEVYVETNVSGEIEVPTGTADLTHLLLMFDDLVLADNKIGSQLVIRLKRIAATTGTEYPNHVFATQFGIHHESDTVGSRTVSAK